jgi:hypothetical protein
MSILNKMSSKFKTHMQEQIYSLQGKVRWAMYLREIRVRDCGILWGETKAR